MFSHMVGTLIVATLVAAIVFVAAFAAEGRGERVLRILLGAERRRRVREHLFDEMDRPESTFDLVGSMSRADAGDLGASRS